MSMKLADLATDLRLAEGELARALTGAGITVETGVKRIPDKEARRLRAYILDQRKRTIKKQERVRLPSALSVREFAAALDLPPSEVIAELLKNGLVVTLNEHIDYETAAVIASDLGYQTEEDVAATEEGTLTPEKLWEILKKEEPSRQEPRPPVITIMGHIDHGKTTLLDAIRQANVAAEEAGGITQAITGYQVRKKGKTITFIDTPGHEAFEFMRKRGASLADIAILVVAADEGVKEQTLTALRHAQEAEIPIVVALTKVDKPETNLERTKRQLADAGLPLEGHGGDVPVVAVSAKTRQGLDTLLDTIILVNEVHPTRAIPNRPALASVIEAHRDPQAGPQATLLVHTGTLGFGDLFVLRDCQGSTRALRDFAGHAIKEAKPGTPVTILGLGDVPQAGDILQVVEERSDARQKVRATVRSLPKVLAPKSVKLTKEERAARRARAGKAVAVPGGPVLLPLVLKADARGSLEAIRAALTAMSTDVVAVRLLRSDVGAVTDSDIRTAEAAGGRVVAFAVPVAPVAQKFAEVSGVPVETFSVIYRLTEEVRKRLAELTPTEVIRTDHGTLHVLKVFFSIRGRQIIGGALRTGVVRKDMRTEVVRDAAVLTHGTVTDLQENKVRTTEVRAGRECGLTVSGTEKKIKTGDLLRFYTEETRKKGSAP